MQHGIRHLVPALLAAVSLTLAAGGAHAARVGKPAPAFTAVDIDGKPVSLAALKGKHVVLEWHNKGCPFVIKHYASGNLPALQAKWTGQGVVWLSIVSSSPGTEGYCTPTEAKDDIAATKTAATAMILDPEGKLGRLYGAKCTPHMFVINPKGTLVYDGALDDHASTDAEDIPQSKNWVDQALTESLAGRKVSVSSTRPYGCGIKYAKK